MAFDSSRDELLIRVSQHAVVWNHAFCYAGMSYYSCYPKPAHKQNKS